MKYPSKPIRSALFITAVVGALSAAPNVLAQRPVGLDVSSYQGQPNWSSIKGSGRSFAWAKATEGTYFIDPDFSYNMNNGKAAGVLMGAYHFARPDLNSPGTEATYFWNQAASYLKNDGKSIMPTLDFETFNGVVGASSYSDWVNQWCDAIVNKAAAAGIKARPVVYVSSCNACYLNSSVSQWISWLANYNGQSPQTGSPWSVCGNCNAWGGGNWDAWQYSSSGSVPGVSGSCDVDVWNGNSADLNATLLIGSGNSTEKHFSFVGPITINSDGRLEMFTIGSNGDVWHNYQNSANSGWNGWIDMANGNSFPQPACTHDKDGRLEAFASTGSGRVWHNFQVVGGGGAWNGWGNQNGPSVTNLIALTNADGRCEVFGIATTVMSGTNGRLLPTARGPQAGAIPAGPSFSPASRAS